MPCACKQREIPQYPDTSDWGPILWTILHGLAEKSGRSPIPIDEVREWIKLLEATAQVLPCEKCRIHFAEFLNLHPTVFLKDMEKAMQKDGPANKEYPYNSLRPWIRDWFWALHNRVNEDSSKPIYSFDSLETTYKNVDFKDQFLRLEPAIKKAVQLSGISLLKWTNWANSYKKLRASIAL